MSVRQLLNRVKRKMILNKRIHALFYFFRRLFRDEFVDSLLSGGVMDGKYNINYDPCTEQKRVLICYVLHNSCTEHEYHTNLEESYVIEKYFIDRNYIVDIVDSMNGSAVSRNNMPNYNIIFGFGESYRVATKKWLDAIRVEYFTESPYFFSLNREQERLDYFYQRYGIQKKVTRTGTYYNEDDEYNADYIINMCEDVLLASTSSINYHLSPHGLRNAKYIENDFTYKDIKSFLVFGTAGYIHKGIDILIEAFSDLPEYKLYICGSMEEYLTDFKRKLPANIFLCGMIDVQSDRFVELVKKCAFVILPSCSEATPSGVITCMRHGLIPVISRKLGLDNMGEYVKFFDDYSIPHIREVVITVANIDRMDLWKLSNKVYEYANECFSIHKFKENFYKNMDAIINDNKGLGGLKAPR